MSQLKLLNMYTCIHTYLFPGQPHSSNICHISHRPVWRGSSHLNTLGERSIASCPGKCWAGVTEWHVGTCFPWKHARDGVPACWPGSFTVWKGWRVRHRVHVLVAWKVRWKAGCCFCSWIDFAYNYLLYCCGMLLYFRAYVWYFWGFLRTRH